MYDVTRLFPSFLLFSFSLSSIAVTYVSIPLSYPLGHPKAFDLGSHFVFPFSLFGLLHSRPSVQRYPDSLLAVWLFALHIGFFCIRVIPLCRRGSVHISYRAELFLIYRFDIRFWSCRFHCIGGLDGCYEGHIRNHLSISLLPPTNSVIRCIARA
jgi:hypothetical protein